MLEDCLRTGWELTRFCLTDKHKLRRSQINAAAREATAAAFLKSLRRQLHALLGCGPAMCFAIRRHTVQPARIRKLRRTGQVSKALRRPDRAKAIDHHPEVDHGRRARTDPLPEPTARTSSESHPATRLERAARPGQMVPQKNSANHVTEL